MSANTYLNFDLSIERAAEGYRVQAQSSAGEAANLFTIPFSDLELENFILNAGPGRRGVRRIDTPEVAAAKKFGGKLFSAAFAGDVGNMLRDSLNDAWHQKSKLRIRLRLIDAPELADIPWEFLYTPALNRFLALDDDTAIVRYLDLPERVRPVLVTLPLRVLVMISHPTDVPQLDVEQEWSKLNEALSQLKRGGLVQLDLLEKATLPAVRQRLQQEQYHIFHFIGHGGFDKQNEEGVLILEDETERSRLVSGQQLGWLLHNHDTLSLAILNACEGARADRSDAFAGTAQSLVQQGIPAVIAMQFEITDEAAKTFAHAFYSSLAAAHPVEAAITETRLALFAEGHGLEWGTPVLFTRSPDGQIFDVRQMNPGERVPLSQAASLYREAQDAMSAEDWNRAVEKLRGVLYFNPTHQEAASMLAQAEQRSLMRNPTGPLSPPAARQTSITSQSRPKAPLVDKQPTLQSNRDSSPKAESLVQATGQDTSQKNPISPTQRPVGVTILAVLAIINGVLSILVGIPVLLGMLGGGLIILVGVVSIGIGSLYLAFGIGAWGLKPWAWILGVFVQTLSLFSVLIQAIFVQAEITSAIVGTVIPAIILVYLFTPNVRQAFGRA